MGKSKTFHQRMAEGQPKALREYVAAKDRLNHEASCALGYDVRAPLTWSPCNFTFDLDAQGFRLLLRADDLPLLEALVSEVLHQFGPRLNALRELSQNRQGVITKELARREKSKKKKKTAAR